MQLLSANYIYTGTSILTKKVIAIDEKNVIVDILDASDIDAQKVNFFDGILCPGFINAHCHLELSHLFETVKEKTGLDNFIADIEQYRKASDNEIFDAIEKANYKMESNGIVAVGDICNTANTFAIKQNSKINYHNFLEIFAFHPTRAQVVFEHGLKLLNQFKSNVSITPHAPYSASAKLLKLISDFALENNSILTIHNQETEDENLMFQKKEGKVIERIKKFGIETDFWTAPRQNSIVATLKQLPTTLKIQLVHNTFTSHNDIQWANNFNPNLFWCFCVNANKFIENTIPNITLFANNNCKITIGTDSLASNWSLNILDELKTISAAFPQISLQQLIQWSTINGAEYLGLHKQLGSIAVGKAPGINNVTGIENNKLTQYSKVKKVV